jgi:DNA replication factor GINS
MNLDELRSALDTERQKGGLQGLRDSFYQEVAEFVEELKAERDQVAAESDDPFGSPEVQRLTDQIDTARSTAESLYERRLGKLVKQASLAAADMASLDQVKGLTDEERVLYDDLVDRIEGNKDHMFDVIAGEATTTPAVAGDDSPAHHPEDGMETGTGGSTVASEQAARETADPTTASEADSSTGAAADDERAPGDDSATDVAAAEASAVAGADGTESGDDGVSAADVMGETPSAGEEPSPGDPATDGSGVAAQSTEAGAEPVTAGGTAESTGTGDASTGRSDGGTGDESGTGEDGGAAVERTTVRITDEVGEILGVDQREYRLGADDVVTLPTANAEPLLDREAAERLD